MLVSRAGFIILLLGGFLLVSCSSGEAPTEPPPPPANNPPGTPSDPSPSDGATGVTFSPILAWSCLDPDADPLVYDVYFGTGIIPPLVISNLTDSAYTPVGLIENTTYYWKVVARDGGGLTGEGPVWSFTTAALASNQISSFGSLPRWSPDGQTLLFGGEGMTMGLWVYDRVTESLEQISDNSYPHRWDYAWSPGSDQIAFGGAGPISTAPAGIFTLALDGSDPVQWHPTGHSPCWIPDGSGLVFSEEDPQAGIYGLFKLLFADTSLAQLTASGVDAEFNPAGTRIAYRDPGPSQAYALRVINADGSQMITLTDNCLRFGWTADGVTIVYDYMSYALGMVISTVPAAGGVSSVLKIGAVEPSLASTGRIAYQGLNVDLSLGIFTVNLDGSNTSQITSSGAQPSITPDGTLIAYTREDGIWLAYP